MYDLRIAANLYDVERAYRRPLLRRMVDAIKPERDGRIWTRKYRREECN